MLKPIKLTGVLLQPYFFDKKKHSGYEQTVKEYRALKVHVNGEYPAKLIDERRPNELDIIKDYRKKIYEPITYDTTQKVLSSLMKIRRSIDWNVDYKGRDYPTTVSEEERMGEFVTKSFPVTETYENWLFTIMFKNYITDPNAIVLVRPIETDIDTTTYIEPFPFIYNSPQIYEYIPEQLLIIALDSDTDEVKKNQPVLRPKKFLVANTEVIERYELKDDKYVSTWEYKHGLGRLPAFKAKGMFHDMVGRNSIFRSRIYPMVPRLNDASREYSDLQAEVVLHIHSEKWTVASEKCDKCADSNGQPSGFVKNGTKTGKITCPECGGSKLKSSTPYKTMVIRPAKTNMGEQPVPNPPMGYIQKDIEIVKVQNDRVNEHLYKALSSINMEFLDQTPLNQSGVAKEVDKDELNNFVFSVAEDLVRISDNYFRIAIDYRYSVSIPSVSKRRKILPEQRTPEKFDLLTSNYLAKEIGEVNEAGVNSIIGSELEKEFAGKKFYNDPQVREKVGAILDLDPMIGLSEDNKMVRVSTNGVSRLTYVISSNISTLVEQAIAQSEGFLDKTLSEQKVIIETLAKVLMKSIDEQGIEVPEIE